MRNIEKFYDNTKDAIPNNNVKKFIELKTETGSAIELGCGAGRDTIYLIKKGWNVLAIDREDVSNFIIEKLNDEELNRFRFQKQNFEKLELENNDLIVANFSIPFCCKSNFEELWNKITYSMLRSGYFVGNFFGLNDEWAKIKNDMTFLSKEDVLSLFNDFEIISFKEIEKDMKTGLGKMKHWHIFDVIAKKK